MSDRDDPRIDADLLALYRCAAVERPSGAADEAVLKGAASALRRARYMPWAALAATLAVVALLAPAARRQLSTSYDHHAAEAYLMQVQAPVAPADAAGPAEAYLMRLPPVSAGL